MLVISAHFTFLNSLRELQEEDSKGADQCPDFLSPEQHQMLSGKPSLKGLTERLGDTKKKTLLQVHPAHYFKYVFPP